MNRTHALLAVTISALALGCRDLPSEDGAAANGFQQATPQTGTASGKARAITQA